MNDEFLEKLEEYYKLKNMYELKYNDLKKNILKNPEYTLKQKQDRFAKIKKKCVNCSKEGGTIFKTENGILIAKCGNKNSPCYLNIKLNRGKFVELQKIINDFEDVVKDDKELIMQVKLDLLFNFSDEEYTLNQFEKIKQELNDNLEVLVSYKEQFINTIENLDNKPELESKMMTFDNIITSIQENMKTYNINGNYQIIKDIVNLYVNDLQPLLSEIVKLKYKTRFMIEKDNVNYLVRKTYQIEDLYVPFEDPEIISFQVGKQTEKEDLKIITQDDDDDDDDDYDYLR